MKIKIFYLPTKNRDRLLEELEYENNNLAALKKMKQTSIIEHEIKQTEHTLNRINDRLNKTKKAAL